MMQSAMSQLGDPDEIARTLAASMGGDEDEDEDEEGDDAEEGEDQGDGVEKPADKPKP
jgi:hypothetical protein